MREKRRWSRVDVYRRLAAAVLACGVLTVQTGCRAEQPWPLWQQYRAKFIDANGRVIDHDANAGEHTTSEGMAYAMFFALVVNDRPTFDKVLRWTEDNLAAGDMTVRLPSWSWGKSPEGQWGILDKNSAGDADLWLAYDLIEAGRLWKDDRLSKMGLVMADHIAHSEIALSNTLGTVLLPGPSGFRPNPTTLILNPSYSPPQLFARLKQEQPAGPWGAALDALPGLIGASAPNGFIMDWVVSGATTSPSGTPAELAAGKTDAVPVGSYEAIRVYLWLGIADKSTEGVARSLSYANGMSHYMQGNVVPPLQIAADGRVVNPEGTVGFSAALIPYLTAVGLKDQVKTQMTRLGASADPATGLYGRSTLYYDQNLALFATGWQEGRFRFDHDGRLKLKWK